MKVSGNRGTCLGSLFARKPPYTQPDPEKPPPWQSQICAHKALERRNKLKSAERQEGLDPKPSAGPKPY